MAIDHAVFMDICVRHVYKKLSWCWQQARRV